jgi:hypothetical protein
MNMTVTKNSQSETLSLTAWSHAVTGPKVLAIYLLDEDSRYVDIQPSSEMEPYFKSIGLVKKARGYELDTVDAPIGSVAKAFGFNYDDLAVRQMLNDKTGGALNPENLSALAKMGYAQLGKIVSKDQELVTHYQINLEQVISTQAATVPSVLFSTGSVEGEGLQRDAILLRTDAKTLRHGYLVSCTNSNHAIDRLALYVATTKGLSEINGVTSDQFVGFKKTENGHRVAVFLDPSKPEIQINEFTQSSRGGKGTINVPRELIDAKNSALPANSAIRSGSFELLSKFLIARHLKELAQDSLQELSSSHYNAPMISGGKLIAGPLSISQDVTLKEYKDRAKSLISRLNKRIDSQAMLLGHKLDAHQHSDLVRAITHAVLDTFKHTVETCSDLERLEMLGKTSASAHQTSLAKHHTGEDDSLGR